MRTGEVRHAERARFGKPLDGVRVLALEQMQALPFGTQLLAHLGAEVVKVEPPEGESGRLSRPLIPDADGRAVGATYHRNNLGKQSLALDWKQPAGRELVLRLLPHFDVLAENFRPGALARAGLDYASLARHFPRLVYVSISGFGHLVPTPYAERPAYAPVAEAMAGLYEPLRKPGEPPPVVVAGALGDNASALYAVIGTLAALRQRERTGRGQHVDVAMFDSMIAMTDMVPFMWSVGEPPSAATSLRTGLVAAFAARDGYFVIAVLRDHQFERLAALLGHPEWVGDPRFATREGWAEHRESVVRPALERWARAFDKQEAAALLCAQGIPAGPSNEAPDLVADAHVKNRDMLIEVPRADGGRPMLVSGNPVKLSDVAEGPLTPSPRLDEHGEAILRKLLGLDDAELERLRAQGAIGRAPRGT
jgi:formyl-CoA transferase